MDRAIALTRLSIIFPLTMSSKEQYDEDMSIHHPHDLLIAKFFPDEDLPSIGYDSMEYLGLYEISCDRERFGQEPCRIP